MDAKLKTLRVADLREILQKVSVPIPAKTNKSDLIAKVLATPAALQAFESQSPSTSIAKQKAPESSQGAQDDDLLAPPEEFDWGSTSAPNGGHTSSAAKADAAVSKPANAKTTAQSTSVNTDKKSTTQGSSSIVPTGTPASATDASKIDEELERRKKRAARFGIPLIEVKSKPSTANGAKASSRAAKLQTSTGEGTAKLEARAARFGMPTVSTKQHSAGGQKRARSPAPVDKEEVERRKKRAERFASSGAQA